MEVPGVGLASPSSKEFRCLQTFPFPNYTGFINTLKAPESINFLAAAGPLAGGAGAGKPHRSHTARADLFVILHHVHLG